MSKEDEIVEATIDLVAEKGLMNFSSKDVTERVGCSSALIYKFFNTNDFLFKRCGEVIKEHRNRISQEIVDSVDGYYGPHDLIYYLFANYIEKALDKPNYCRFYYALAGTKYDWIVADIDDRNGDPFFHGFIKLTGIDVESIDTGTLISFDCTRMALNQAIRSIVRGIVPDAYESYSELARLITEGISSFFEKKE